MKRWSTSSVGKSVYDGFTVGMRKHFSRRYQLEWNYTFAKDKDDDSNERDPFTDRAFDINNLQLDYAYSDRDIRHRFNFFTYIEMGWGFEGNFRVQGRTAQPITPAHRTATNRNTARKDNEYFSFDWRLQRPIKLERTYLDRSHHRDVQYLQQRQQHQPARHARSFQLRRLLASGRGRSHGRCSWR